MNWTEVCADPYFRDAPYKVELDQHGKVVMSPANLQHSLLQLEIGALIRQYARGVAATECPVKIGPSIRVPDVAWMAPETYESVRGADVATVTPDICVEILSSSNTNAEMEEKMALYFNAGAKEVWLCNMDGRVRFFGMRGEMIRSTLVPEFPLMVVLP
jgi:Uma2 family endonuclease